MKDIRPALRAFLIADAPIAALVADRVYPNQIPQGVNATCVVYTRVSGRSGHYMGGRDGLAFTRFQIDAWAKDQDAAAALANRIKDRLDGFSGVMGEGDGAVTVQGAFFRDEREDYDDAARLHRMSRDYFLDHEEL